MKIHPSQFLAIISLLIILVIGYLLLQNNSYEDDTTEALHSNLIINTGTILNKPLDIKFDYQYICNISLKCDSNILKKGENELIITLFEHGKILKKQQIKLSHNQIRDFYFSGEENQELNLVIESNKLTNEIKNTKGYITVDVNGGGPSTGIKFHQESKVFINYILSIVIIIGVGLFIYSLFRIKNFK